MNTTPENNGKNGKKRGLSFYLKVILTFFLLIFFAAGIAVYYVYHKLTSDDKFEEMLMARISTAINMQVRFDKLDISFPGFTIKDASVATDSPDLKLDARISEISITPDFWAAFNGKLVLDSLNLSSGTINLQTSGKKAAPPDAGKVASATPLNLEKIAFPFNSLSARMIQLNYLDGASAKTHSLVLKNASLEKSLLSSALPFNLELSSPQYADLSLEGQLYWPETVKVSLSLVNVNRKEIMALVPKQYQKQLAAVEKPELRLNALYKLTDNSLKLSEVNISAEPGLKLNAGAEFTGLSPLNGNFSGSLAPVSADFLLKLAGDMVPAEYQLKAGKGMVGAKIELGFSNSAISTTKIVVTPKDLSLSAKMLPETVAVDSGSISYDGKKLQFSALKAGLAGSRIELTSGEAMLEPVGFTGKLTANIDFDALWPKIKPMLPEAANRVTPGGKAAFNGTVAYQNEKFALDGELNSSLLKLREASSKAEGQLENVKVKFVQLSPTAGKIEIASLKLKGAGGDVGFSGTVTNGTDPAFNLKASGMINLADFSALAASIFKLPVRTDQFSGEISLDLALGGTLADLQPQGSLGFKKIKADLKERGMVVTNLNGNAAANMKSLEVKQLSAELMGGKLELSGSINDFKKPMVKAQASVQGANLAQIRNFIGLNFPEMPKELEVSGQADVSVTVDGAIAEPKVAGSSTLKSVRFFHPAVLRPLEAISGPVSFNNAGLTTTRLEAKWGTSAVVVKGSLQDWGKLISDFSFDVNPLDATDAAGFFLAETGYKLTATGNGSGKITGELEKIKVSGRATLPQGLLTAPVSEKSQEVFKFPFKDLQAAFVYYEKVFSVDSAETTVFNGKINASGKVDLNTEPISFSFNTRLSQIETSAFLQENSKFKNALRGGVDGSADIKGDTTGLASINGVASLLMKKGAYVSPPVVQKICEQLNAMHLASGTIENLSGDYAIANGRISSKNTMAKSKDGKMTYTGSIGLDTTLDGTLVLDINRAACQQSQLLKQMVGNSETLSVPVSLKGNLTSPSVGIPLDKMLKDAAQKQIKDSVEKKATDALGKIFGIKKKESAPASSTPAVAQPETKVEEKPAKKIENKLKDVGRDLKKIFKF